MKFLSFDVGIRNLAYCYAEYDEEKENLEILEWDIINVAKAELDTNKKCSIISKRKPYKQCSKNADFMTANGQECFCKAHKNQHYHTKYIAPEIKKIEAPKKENKCCNDDCNKMAKYIVDNKELCPSHKKIIDDNFKKNFALKKLKKVKCGSISTDKITECIVEVLDAGYTHLLDCDIVLIENQLALTAPKMKSIANYIYMYYLIRGKTDKKTIKDIRFYNALNKLNFDKSNDDDDKSSYKDRKKTGIKNVNSYLKYKKELSNMMKFNSHKKKDDLADALLQILSYLQNNDMKI